MSYQLEFFREQRWIPTYAVRDGRGGFWFYMGPQMSMLEERDELEEVIRWKRERSAASHHEYDAGLARTGDWRIVQVVWTVSTREDDPLGITGRELLRFESGRDALASFHFIRDIRSARSLDHRDPHGLLRRGSAQAAIAKDVKSA